MKILGTGLSGLVGSRVVELLSSAMSFENLSLETGVDITDFNSLSGWITKSDAPVVFHFAAFTDVDNAETDRPNGRAGKVWLVNVTATENLARLCRQTKKRLMYISTDYVFSGKKDTYSETDLPDPEGWYGITKYEGEKSVAALGDAGLILRIANPYRAKWPGKPDFVHKIIDSLAAGNHLTAPADQLFIPTLIDDIALAIDVLINAGASGIYHVIGGDSLSPLEATLEIARQYGLNVDAITGTSFAEYFRGRAPRPLRANLNNDKIARSGIMTKPFSAGLSEIRKQERMARK